MKFIKDLNDFYETTGIIIDWNELNYLGIIPHLDLSTFGRGELPKLRRFCLANPAYHILSSLSGPVTVNFDHPDGILFKLGDGDQDPELAFLHGPMIDPFASGLAVRREDV